MHTFRLVLEYDGADFAGWQSQSGGQRTVQGELRAALLGLAAEPEPLRVVGAGRTDAGVHAAGQVASAALITRLGAEALGRALNARLPADIAVLHCAPAAQDFDARRAARGKHYRYQVWNGPVRSPLRARRWHHEPRPLNVEAMRAALRHLPGRRNFASLRAAGSHVQSSIRHLRRAELCGESGGALRFDFEGDGFLRHMLRNAVGTLLEVGLGRRSADSLPAMLAAADRRLAGPTAPAHGLTLQSVACGPGAG